MDIPVFREYFESPAGWIEVTAGRDSLLSILFRGQTITGNVQTSPLTNRCTDQLRAYFRGERRIFDLPLSPEGTPFQLKVWQLVSQVDYGQTSTYHDLARKMGKPAAVRGVGMANSKNRLLIVIPCHRIIGADGGMVGYAGELWRKKWLIDLEARYCGTGQMKLNF